MRPGWDGLLRFRMPDSDSRARFIAHNIRFPNGQETLPGRPLLAETPFTRAVLRTLKLVLPSDGRAKARRIIDLGCLEGGYTVEFARAGYEATGLEARKVNFSKCEYVAQNVDLDNLHFVLDDARNVSRYGTFDAVFCAGLLYHLDQPLSFLRQLRTATERVLILDTHVAMQRRPKYWRKRLSRTTENEGVPGRWYDDYRAGISREDLEGALEASYGNPRSFWVEKMHLINALREVGFSSIYEQFDCLANIVDNVRLNRDDRPLLVAIP